MATLGRLVLLWRADGRQRELKLLDLWHQRPVWPPRKFAAGARACLVGHEAVGVLEPDGHFLLLALPDGKTIADVKLEPEKSLLGIVVIRSGGHYLLVTQQPVRGGIVARRTIQFIPGILGQPIIRGRAYALDLEGKLLWPGGVTIKDQHLLLDQPGRLPIFTFACQVYDRSKSGSGRHQVSLLCLDKRSGRVVYETNDKNRIAGSTSGLDIVGDPKKKTVQFQLSRGMVTLTFTDKPQRSPDRRVDQASHRKKGPRAARALFDAIGKAIIETAGESAEEAEGEEKATEKPAAKQPAPKKPAPEEPPLEPVPEEPALE